MPASFILLTIIWKESANINKSMYYITDWSKGSTDLRTRSRMRSRGFFLVADSYNLYRLGGSTVRKGGGKVVLFLSSGCFVPSFCSEVTTTTTINSSSLT